MLRDLHVRNLAVLAEASVAFAEGFNVLSGETGAGKSMVVDALGLLAGGRADSSLIRTGADRLSVTGVFEPTGSAWREVLAESGIEADADEVVVRREISHQDRNRIFVNDQPVTQKLLADLGPFLMTLHGQREELGLMQPELQRQWLDHSGGDAAISLLQAVEQAYLAYREARSRLDRVSGDDRARLERIELLRFQIRDIDAVGLVPGEEEELRTERDQLRHAEAILGGLGEAESCLSEDEAAALAQVEGARHGLEGIRRWIPAATEWLEELEEARIRLQDVADSVSRQLSIVELDPGRLDTVEERLVRLERLFHRFGETSQEVLDQRDRAFEELSSLEVDAEGREGLQREVEKCLSRYRERALELTSERRRWADELAARVQSELADLALGKARFSTRLETSRRDGSVLAIEGKPVDFGPHGVDQVVFEFAANPGEDPRPLSKVASGGELARVYLGLQLAVRGAGKAAEASMVFDEVDAGIGGREAAAVGRKLRRLARGGQILAVTHLPQVAACAHHHFKIEKSIEGGRTFVAVEALDKDRQVEEVARMLAGDEITKASLSHAGELISAGAAD
ncbi:MAG: DNA repair protein RecN [Thermoanaerobaculia bacterium]|nr:DNA repair protein RecN [Thermoanaerobaculia bacterium]